MTEPDPDRAAGTDADDAVEAIRQGADRPETLTMLPADLLASKADLSPPMGAAYQRLVDRLMKDRDAATAAVRTFPREHRVVISGARPRNDELEALQEVAQGVDLLAHAQKTTAEAQERAANQLVEVAKLLGGLDATIQAGDKSNSRLAKVAILIAVLLALPTFLSTIAPFAGELADRVAQIIASLRR
jgi:hypothetical protein